MLKDEGWKRRDRCGGIARGAGFSSQKQELPIHLTYMKKQQLSLLTPSVTICTNKTDGGQRCRQITSGHLSLHGNSLLNK